MLYTQAATLFGILAVLAPNVAATTFSKGTYKINVVSQNVKVIGASGQEINFGDKGEKTQATAPNGGDGVVVGSNAWTFQNENGQKIWCKLTGAPPAIEGGESIPVFNFGEGPNYLFPCDFPATAGQAKFGMDCHNECGGPDKWCDYPTCQERGWAGGATKTWNGIATGA